MASDGELDIPQIEETYASSLSQAIVRFRTGTKGGATAAGAPFGPAGAASTRIVERVCKNGTDSIARLHERFAVTCREQLETPLRNGHKKNEEAMHKAEKVRLCFFFHP